MKRLLIGVICVLTTLGLAKIAWGDSFFGGGGAGGGLGCLPIGVGDEILLDDGAGACVAAPVDIDPITGDLTIPSGAEIIFPGNGANWNARGGSEFFLIGDTNIDFRVDGDNNGTNYLRVINGLNQAAFQIGEIGSIDMLGPGTNNANNFITSTRGITLNFDTNNNDSLTFDIQHAGTTVLEMDGSGNLEVDGDVKVGNTSSFFTPIQATAPTEPVACAAGVVGSFVYVDDTDDTTTGLFCACVDTDDGTTFDWVRLDDNATACPFF